MPTLAPESRVADTAVATRPLLQPPAEVRIGIGLGEGGAMPLRRLSPASLRPRHTLHLIPMRRRVPPARAERHAIADAAAASTAAAAVTALAPRRTSGR